MKTAAIHTASTSLKSIALVCVLAAVITACAAPAQPATPESQPEVVPSEAPTVAPEPTDAPPTAVPSTDVPPTAEPTEPPATPTQPAPTATTPPSQSARYELVFEATWSAATHPTDFPSNPHFSPLIGAAHGPSVLLWDEGVLASPGMKNMAETGGTSPLDGEIDALIADGTACEAILGGGVPVSPGSVAVSFEVNLDCPLISIVTMIAPSPDWFVGVHGLSLLQDGAWADELLIPLLPYDAGTDSGPSYASADAPSASPEPIHLVLIEPLLIAGDIPPIGTFTLTRLDG